MVSVITINYNGFEDTCEFIDSMFAVESSPFELIVVDNASRNEEGKRLKERYPHCRVVCSKENLGFAGGNNLGYRQATGDYILYINNDILIKAPFLAALIARLESSKEIGAVSPKIRYSHHPDRIQYAGFTPMEPIVLRNRMIGVGEVDNGQYDVPSETGFLHGACMLTRRETIEEVGCMAEVFFLFYEELDWCMRLKQAGYSLWYEPAAVIYHKESMSIPKGTPLRKYYMTRGRLLFARRNYRGMDRLLACLYQALPVFFRDYFSLLFKGEREMARASWRGVVKGLTDKTN
ncbi:glycosyltransferase family 2 protein [Parabacteroides sp. OttesenSCG-928-N08]|nr:glycosyltransferase family 2 protein [Parabacteroides sp. OttesenSCG-928-N08]